MMENI